MAMVEVGKWILLGGTLGFCLQWVIDARQLKILRSQQINPQKIDELNEQVKILTTNLKQTEVTKSELEKARLTINHLQAELTTAKSRTQTVTPTIPTPQQESQPEPISWQEITSLPPAYVQVLQKAGITSPAELTGFSPAQLKAVLNVQPWDMLDCEQILNEIQSTKPQEKSSSSPATVGPEVPEIVAESFESLPNITPLLVSFLHRAGITSYTQLAAQSPTDLAAAIKIMPWDMLEPSDWINKAKELA